MKANPLKDYQITALQKVVEALQRIDTMKVERKEGEDLAESYGRAFGRCGGIAHGALGWADSVLEQLINAKGN